MNAAGLRPLFLRLSLFCIASIAALTAIDRIVLPASEDRYLFAGPAWKLDDKRINQSNEVKILFNNRMPVWHSQLMPLPSDSKLHRRVLVLGDSFVWGDGYANINDAWWRQLSRELQARGYRDVEVFAAGQCGFSTDQELYLVRRLLPVLKPDVVIFGYVTNDADNRTIHQMMKAPIGLVDRLLDRITFRRFFPEADELIRSLAGRRRMQALAGPGLGYPYDEWEYKLVEGESLKAYRKTLADVASYMRGSKTPYLFLALPWRADRKRLADLYGAVEPLFRQARIPFVVPLDEFFAAYRRLPAPLSGRRALWINGANSHPGPFTAHFFATEAADVLESKYRSVLGRRSRSTQPAKPEINDTTPPVWITEISPGSYKIEYPWKDEVLLRMPMRKPHIQLNLADAVPIAGFILSGPAITSAELFVTRVDPELGFDDRTVLDLGARRGNDLSWDGLGPDVRINTLMLSIRFSDVKRQSAKLRLVPFK